MSLWLICKSRRLTMCSDENEEYGCYGDDNTESDDDEWE